MPEITGLCITLFHDGEQASVTRFNKARVLIGRDLAADLVLDSTHVSRRHVIVEHDGVHVFVRDAGSKNGVWIDAERVQSRQVGPHEHIIVGDYAIEVTGEVAGEPTGIEAVNLGGADADSQRDTAPQQSSGSTHNSDDMQAAADTGPLPTGSELWAMDGEPLQTAFGVDDTPGLASVFDMPHVPLDYDSVDDHDEEYDDDGTPFSPPYSLSKRLLQSSGGVVGRSPGFGLEMLCVVQEQVAHFAFLPVSRKAYRLASDLPSGSGQPPGLRQLHAIRQGESIVTCDRGLSGRLRRDGRQLDLEQFFVPHKRTQMQGVLKKADVLSLFDGHAYYHLRHLPLPPLPPDRRPWWQRMGLQGHTWRTMLASCVLHVVVAIVVTLCVPEHPPQPPAPEFTVTLKKQPQLKEVAPPEKKPEPPKPHKMHRPPPHPPRPKPTPRLAPKRPSLSKPVPVAKPEPKPQPAPKPQPVPVAQPVPTPPKPQPNPKPQPAPVVQPAPKPQTPPKPAAPAGILGLLAKHGATAAPGPSAAVDAVSNLAAAHAPANAGGYRISGLIGKLPTSSGVVFGGGHANVVTKGANALLRGGAGGSGKLAARGTSRIGGLVQKVPQGVHMGGTGSLDKLTIDKVVNAHADEIQRCYERELQHDSAVGGKLQVQWVIATDGRVASVRQVFSSLNSAGAVRCIMDAIRTWKFPHPVGGAVLVDYPWVFSSDD